MTDLPKPENRWLIDATTGFIEAWDHTGNPESGNDTAALLLCVKALGKEGWDHPSYTRKEATTGALDTCRFRFGYKHFLGTKTTVRPKRDPFEGIMEGAEMMPLEKPEET